MSERRQSHREGRSRSPAPAPAVGPVAVKVEESAINKPLPDAYSVDREKVKQQHAVMVRYIWNVIWFADLSYASAGILQCGQTPQSGRIFKKLTSFK